MATLAAKPQLGVEQDGIRSHFQVIVNGQVNYGKKLYDSNCINCKYSYVYGQDWQVLTGLEDGISQYSRRTTSSEDSRFVWNFPIDITFRSTNPFGWPRIILSVYALDSRGNDIVLGYGSMLIPTQPGLYHQDVYLYTPISSSKLREFIAWLTGERTEFYNANFVADSRGRESTRVKCSGLVNISLNVVTRQMELCGFSNTRKLK